MHERRMGKISYKNLSEKMTCTEKMTQTSALSSYTSWCENGLRHVSTNDMTLNS